MLSEKYINAFIKDLSETNENSSILKEDRVVKLPKKPIYAKIYNAPLNLFKKYPAIADPIILTNIVAAGRPKILKFKRVRR